MCMWNQDPAGLYKPLTSCREGKRLDTWGPFQIISFQADHPCCACSSPQQNRAVHQTLSRLRWSVCLISLIQTPERFLLWGLQCWPGNLASHWLQGSPGTRSLRCKPRLLFFKRPLCIHTYCSAALTDATVEPSSEPTPVANPCLHLACLLRVIVPRSRCRGVFAPP